MSVIWSAQQALDETGAVLLDVREPTPYLAGHAPGARPLSAKSWEEAAKATDFSDAAFWHGQISALGIDGSRVVAVYDDGKLTEAARIWFVLQLFGVDAKVVDGGWPALERLLGAAVSTRSEPVLPAVLNARQRLPIVGLVTRGTLKTELGQERLQIFDARTAAEFDGSDRRNNARSGHLPGAKRIGHTDLLSPNGLLRPRAELKALLASSGFAAENRIVTHCDGGGRAALAAIAAHEAGYAEVEAYYLSFSDWARDASCPIER